MNTTKQQHKLQDFKINVRLKLAALWASLMFVYIYVDYFHLYMPGKIEDILDGRVFEFDITFVFLMIALVSVTIPAIMIYLSLVLPARVNLKANKIKGWEMRIAVCGMRYEV